MRLIDLRSDTVTRPTPAMREAIAAAEVGDDVYGEDPSVNRLQARVAERLGKAAALLVPSGTMANQIAIRCHTEPGDAVVAGVGAHLYLYESGAAGAISGIQFTFAGSDGLFDADDLRDAIQPPDAHFARTRLVCAENTHNRSGGRVFPLADLDAVTRAARDQGLVSHLDGARLFNAEVATGVPAARIAEGFDSVSVCLSKGLGAPVGSLLAGSAAFVRRAHRFRKQLGGGMRQAGILAAAGSYALERHVKRLAEDHANARRLARGLERIPGITLLREPQTNMVLFQAPDTDAFVARTRERGVLINPIEARTLRAVTHLDVSASDIETGLERIEEAMR